MEKVPENTKEQLQRFTFKKNERLCSKKIIDKLFAEGSSFLCYPVKVVYLKTELPSKAPVQAGFTVSKKLFKKAVKRIAIKRKMKEAYRLNKTDLYSEAKENQLALFFIYVGKQELEYQTIEFAIKKSVKRINSVLFKNKVL